MWCCLDESSFLTAQSASGRRRVVVLSFWQACGGNSCAKKPNVALSNLQVEMVRNPSLRDKPLGIQQKNIVVTSNYVARGFGVGKLELVSEAKKKCPGLVCHHGSESELSLLACWLPWLLPIMSFATVLFFCSVLFRRICRDKGSSEETKCRPLYCRCSYRERI
jgi:hypothetical protein